MLKIVEKVIGCCVGSKSRFLTTYVDTEHWLKRMGIGNYKINWRTLVVDVAGHVDISDKDLTSIKVKFGEVDGGFYIHNNPRLKSLVGSPDSAKFLNCNNTAIRDFVGCPQTNEVYATNIPSLISFTGLPKKLDYLCIYGSGSKLTTIDDFPEHIIQLDVSHNSGYLQKLSTKSFNFVKIDYNKNTKSGSQPFELTWENHNKSKDMEIIHNEMGYSIIYNDIPMNLETLESTLKYYDIKNYEIISPKYNPIVDVYGDVELFGDFSKLPFNFGKVTGNFDVSNCLRLTSLAGSPISVNELNCSNTLITDFNGIGRVDKLVANDIRTLKSFSGLNEDIKSISLVGSCSKVNSVEHIPANISEMLIIGQDFNLSLLRELPVYIKTLPTIKLTRFLSKYDNIISLLEIKTLGNIITDSCPLAGIIINKTMAKMGDDRDISSDLMVDMINDIKAIGFENLVNFSNSNKTKH